MGSEMCIRDSTRGVSIDFLSSGYLDVSVPRVCSYKPMYSVYKYLFQNVINYRSNNNKLSGGLPHSEICGSKLILSSPQLIAEYHVLHRLLLPRHSPNALLALDLIQKKTGLFRSRQPFCENRQPDPSIAGIVIKSILFFPPPPTGSSEGVYLPFRRTAGV